MIDDKIRETKEIVAKAIKEHPPYAIVGMFSGGGDSLGMLAALKACDIKLDFILHGITGTGLPQTLDFVRKVGDAHTAKYIEGNAGEQYERYVLRKGFFGRGKRAHEFAYHKLKSEPFERALSKEIIQGKRNRRILLINGVREEESDNRSKNYDGEVVNVYPRKPNNIWVNAIFWWNKSEITEFLASENIEISPTHKVLGRSGECNCGTMQSQADRIAASEFCPAWGKWIDELEKRVIANGFPWRWGQDISKRYLMEKDGQINMFEDMPMPMCVGCKSRAKLLSND